MSNTLMAIDGNSLLHRAYWAIPPMNDSSGRPTNAVYGFFMMLFRLYDEYKPDHLAVAFDVHAPTFRHKTYKEYKQGRRQTPGDLLEQFDILKNCLSLTGVRYVECPGFEADDILGTLAKRADMPSFVVTGDKDELQLISTTTSVVFTVKGVTDTKVMTEDALMEDYGLRPDQIPDLKGLMGDTSDNLPGVAGVGEKTALKLLHTWKTVANLYDHIDELPKNKMREKLIAGMDSAFMCRDLAKIDVDAPLDVTVDDLRFDGFDVEGAHKMIRDYEFRSFASRFAASVPEAPETIKEGAKVTKRDLDLFPMLLEHENVAVLLEEDALRFSVSPDEEFLIDRTEHALEDIAPLLKDLFARTNIISYDVKSLMHVFSPLGIEFVQFEDLMIASWVLNPSYSSYSLDDIMQRAGLTSGAAACVELWDKYHRKLQDDELTFIYQDVEKPLLPVLYAMEAEGVLVSREELEKLGSEYGAEMDRLSREIFELAGEEFNLGSPKQLAVILFEKLHLKPGKKTRTGYSTNIAVLEKLKDDHPIIPLIIEYRAVAKLKNTYIDGLLAAVHDGKLHTTFLQTATATGRLSSSEPNLQNIPIRSKMAADIRRAFMAPKGYTIVSADYSQIELRILASRADDANLKAAFLRGEDIHARTAAEILGKSIDDVTKDERSHAKAVNFGIVYGISDFGLSQSTGLSKKEASKYIDSYLHRFPGVREYMDEIKEFAREKGYVRTLMGRIRYIPDIHSKNFNVRSAGERAALNTPIQGTAADIMKIAMIKVHKELSKLDVPLVLQVHDELIAYVRDSEVEKVKRILKETMENAVTLSVPLEANTASGKTWHEAK